MIFVSLHFVETLRRLVSTCFQRYIKKVYQADLLFLRAVLPLKNVKNIGLFPSTVLADYIFIYQRYDDFIRRIHNIIDLPSDVYS